MLLQPAKREYRTWILDSRRWENYRARPSDVILASHPKSGTTWMLRIINLLISQSTEPRSLDTLSPWIDRRFPPRQLVSGAFRERLVPNDRRSSVEFRSMAITCEEPR